MDDITLTNSVPPLDFLGTTYMGYEFLPIEEAALNPFLVNIQIPVAKKVEFLKSDMVLQEVKDTLHSMICHLLIYREDIHFHRPVICYLPDENTFIVKMMGSRREEREEK